MQSLQSRADELKEEQLRIRQVINEKNTASILVGLFSTATTAPPSDQNNNPEVEKLLRRPEEEIPDAAKIPELPALILPGQHNSKKKKRSAAAAAVLEVEDKEALPDDGIDYQLLGKERAKCSPAELDQIRRERNRMHAKRSTCFFFFPDYHFMHQSRTHLLTSLLLSNNNSSRPQTHVHGRDGGNDQATRGRKRPTATPSQIIRWQFNSTSIGVPQVDTCCCPNECISPSRTTASRNTNTTKAASDATQVPPSCCWSI